MGSVRTIYVVDDDDDDRMLVREALEEIIDNIVILEAIDGQHLLELLFERGKISEPVLVLLDINMPRMNGLETLARIRSNPDSEHIPVIMFSTSSEPNHIANAYGIGVNAYLKKPVSIVDYAYMAESVNICFLNNYPSANNGLTLKRSRTKSILVVEDNADHWELMHFALTQSMPNAIIFRMKDSESAVDFLETQWHEITQPPQLVLLDLYIPTRQQGLLLLEKIRTFLTENNLPTVPIIIFSNSEHQDDIKACYQRQANAYMIKPLDLGESISYFKTLNEFIWDAYTV